MSESGVVVCDICGRKRETDGIGAFPRGWIRASCAMQPEENGDMAFAVVDICTYCIGEVPALKKIDDTITAHATEKEL